MYRCVAKSAANQPTMAPRLTIAIGYVAPGPDSGLAWSYRRNKALTGPATHAVYVKFGQTINPVVAAGVAGVAPTARAAAARPRSRSSPRMASRRSTERRA